MNNSQVGGLSRLVNKNTTRPDVYKIEQEFTGNAVDRDTQRKIAEEIDAISERLGLKIDEPKPQFTPAAQDDDVEFQLEDEPDDIEPQFAQSVAPPQPLQSMQPSFKTQDYRTAEQFKRDRVSAVIGEVGEEYAFENERKEDIKNSMLEQIDFLKTTLESEEMDISRMPNVNHASSFADIENTLKILKFKYDRVRYSTLADEVLMIGAYGLEELFDGQRVWFNKYRPDLTGWNKKLRTKLRRMRHNTSSIVGQFVQEYNIGPMLSTLMEIVPNMIQHSFENSRRKESENKYEEDMRNATEAIRDMRNK